MPCFNAASALNDPHEPIEDQDEEEDDGLGYYPDGVKRTLTDEQIAMFRASEIYALIRERQVRTENDEAEGRGQQMVDIKPQGEDGDGHVNESSKPTVPPSAFPKRKRSSESTNEHRVSVIKSTRRMVRELDSAIKDTGVLNYGDEPSTEMSRPEVPSGVHKQSDVKGLESNGSGPSYDSTKLVTSKQKPPGRKIWWPKIGS